MKGGKKRLVCLIVRKEGKEKKLSRSGEGWNVATPTSEKDGISLTFERKKSHGKMKKSL